MRFRAFYGRVRKNKLTSILKIIRISIFMEKRAARKGTKPPLTTSASL